MKILAIYQERGSKYHRVKLPLSFFKDHEITFSDGIAEELLAEVDALWIHWNVNFNPTYLSMLRKKYEFKIIVDIDDSWVIPQNHVSRKGLEVSVKLSKQYVAIADWVIISNPLLMEEVGKYNKNVYLIPNALPYGYGQFKLVEESKEDFMNRKIKVGFFGGHNHYNDWTEIGGWINTLMNNPKFKEKADFYLCGYHSSNEWWRKIQSKFSLAKIIEGKTPEDYMGVYDLDISLCPLEDNYFNRCKSDLKVLEAAARKAVCVVDPIYKDLSLHWNHHFVAEKPKDWLDIPLKLIEDKEQLWFLKETSSNLVLMDSLQGVQLYKNPFISKAVKPREEVMTLTPNRFSDYKIWSITYDPNQICEFEFYLNTVQTIEEKSYLFEYNPILDLIPKSQGKYVGVFSWKFGQKTWLSEYEVQNIMESSNEDVISFCLQIPNYLQFSEKHHPGFLKRFTMLCRDLGLQCKEPKISVYSNFFVAKPEVYYEYVELLRKAITLLEDKKYDAFSDAKYKSGLDSETLFKYTGLKHYTWHTFLLERLMSVWIDNKKLRVKNVTYDILYR